MTLIESRGRRDYSFIIIRDLKYLVSDSSFIHSIVGDSQVIIKKRSRIDPVLCLLTYSSSFSMRMFFLQTFRDATTILFFISY